MEANSLSSILAKRSSLHRRLVDQDKLRSELESQIDSLQSLANIGMVTAMIAHEMNNSVNFITGAVPPLKRSLAKLHGQEGDPDQTDGKPGRESCREG